MKGSPLQLRQNCVKADRLSGLIPDMLDVLIIYVFALKAALINIIR